MEKFRLIPFDLQRAKTPSNPDGLEVVTKGDSESVTIVATDFRSSRRHPNGDSLYPILAITHSKFGDRTAFYTCSGLIADDDECDYPGDTLYLKEPIKPRRMTNKELINKAKRDDAISIGGISKAREYKRIVDYVERVKEQLAKN